jgi:prepilin-type N-terminal cleavage/methylation domain-containing protein
MFRSQKKGFTIIESIITIVIFAVAMGAVMGFIIYFYKTNTYEIQQSFAINSARKGIETMVKELREATYSDLGSYPIVEAKDYSFIFYSDIDKDEKIEKIRYFLEGIYLKRGEIEATGDPLKYQDADEVVKVLSDNIRNGEQDKKIFTYFDKNGNEISDLDIVTGINLIKVNLIVNVEPNRAPSEFTLRSSAQFRNFK